MPFNSDRMQLDKFSYAQRKTNLNKLILHDFREKPEE